MQNVEPNIAECNYGVVPFVQLSTFVLYFIPIWNEKSNIAYLS